MRRHSVSGERDEDLMSDWESVAERKNLRTKGASLVEWRRVLKAICFAATGLLTEAETATERIATHVAILKSRRVTSRSSDVSFRNDAVPQLTGLIIPSAHRLVSDFLRSPILSCELALTVNNLLFSSSRRPRVSFFLRHDSTWTCSSAG